MKNNPLDIINSMSNEDMKNALLDMASDGMIIGKCEKCNLPLHFYEITDNKCLTCGDINFENITWFAVDKENMS